MVLKRPLDRDETSLDIENNFMSLVNIAPINEMQYIPQRAPLRHPWELIKSIGLRQTFSVDTCLKSINSWHNWRQLLIQDRHIYICDTLTTKITYMSPIQINARY